MFIIQSSLAVFQNYHSSPPFVRGEQWVVMRSLLPHWEDTAEFLEEKTESQVSHFDNSPHSTSSNSTKLLVNCQNHHFKESYQFTAPVYHISMNSYQDK